MSATAPAYPTYAAFASDVSGSLHRRALRLCGDHQLAEDLVQTTLGKLYAAWPRVARADRPVVYAHGALANTWSSHLRKHSSRELPGLLETEQAAPYTDPTTRLALEVALSTLPALDRRIVLLRYWHGCSIAETALATGLTTAAVKARAFRALRALRTQLAAA